MLIFAQSLAVFSARHRCYTLQRPVGTLPAMSYRTIAAICASSAATAGGGTDDRSPSSGGCSPT
jgi:hypothetical protein